jgi:hypothetical protein
MVILILFNIFFQKEQILKQKTIIFFIVFFNGKTAIDLAKNNKIKEILKNAKKNK